MHYQEYTPSLHLRPFIEKIWTLESDHSDTYPMEHIITPNGAEAIIITYQKVAQKFILNDQLTVLPEVYILMQLHVAWKVITEGCSGIIGVFFKAGCLYTLLKSSIANLIGQVIELQAFLGSKPVRLLREQLVEALPEERIALVEHFFSHYFHTKPHHQNNLRNAVQLIRQYNGMMPIEEIAVKLGISRQAIARQFAEKVGVSPKQYSRLIHFNTVQKFLQKYPHTSWLDITYRFNYFDQSHMIKDFYHFTGISPKGYTALDTFLVDNFALPDLNKKSF